MTVFVILVLALASGASGAGTVWLVLQDHSTAAFWAGVATFGLGGALIDVCRAAVRDGRE